MATRNRTNIFRNHRTTLNNNRVPLSSSSSSSSSSAFKTAVIEMSPLLPFSNRSSYAPLSTTDDPGPCSSTDVFTIGLPPDWVDVSEEVSSNIQKAREKMAELAKVHAKVLTPSFGDGKKDQYKIEELTQEITALLRKSEKKLKKLSDGGPSEDSSIRKNVQRSLATDLQNISVGLRKKHSSYLNRLRQQKEERDGLDMEMNLNENKSRLADDEFSDGGLTKHQMAKVKKSEHFTAEREREINQVLESVNELAQIMKDLSVLVIDQGTIVDRIDYNIQNTATSVEEGLKQLEKAERSQKSGGMVKCATVLVIMCFGMLILLILKEILF